MARGKGPPAGLWSATLFGSIALGVGNLLPPKTVNPSTHVLRDRGEWNREEADEGVEKTSLCPRLSRLTRGGGEGPAEGRGAGPPSAEAPGPQVVAGHGEGRGGGRGHGAEEATKASCGSRSRRSWLSSPSQRCLREKVRLRGPCLCRPFVGAPGTARSAATRGSPLWPDGRRTALWRAPWKRPAVASADPLPAPRPRARRLPRPRARRLPRPRAAPRTPSLGAGSGRAPKTPASRRERGAEGRERGAGVRPPRVPEPTAAYRPLEDERGRGRPGVQQRSEQTFVGRRGSQEWCENLLHSWLGARAPERRGCREGRGVPPGRASVLHRPPSRLSWSPRPCASWVAGKRLGHRQLISLKDRHSRSIIFYHENRV